MKKINLILILAFALCLTASNIWAQPYPPNLTADTYGIAQGGAANGIPTPKDNNDAVPDINDAINALLGTSFARNKDVDHLQWTLPDETWKDLSDDENDGTFILIGLTAANSNTLRVYDVTAPGVKLPVLGPVSGFGFTGAGTPGDPYLAGISPLAAGTNFGFSLRSVNSVTHVWDSDPTANSDGLDHMLTYHLADLADDSVWIKHSCTDITDLTTCTVEEFTFIDPFLITWEDKPFKNGLLGDEDYDDMIYLVGRVKPIIPEPMSMMLFGSGLAGLASIRRKRS